MAKRSYTTIAEHFGADEETVRDSEYHAGRFTRKTYMINDDLWVAGRGRPPTVIGYDEWTMITSSYDKVSILWRAKPEGTVPETLAS